jgi:hypothetical protein
MRELRHQSFFICGATPMTNYYVRFFKNLLSSDGHPFKVLQRAIAVDGAATEDDAVKVAQSRFEQLEHIPDWKLHADAIEAESADKQPKDPLAG